MSSISSRLLLALILWFFIPLAGIAQTTPVREVEVRGKIALEKGWINDPIYILKDGAAVKKAYEELKNPWRKLSNAVSSWEKVGPAPEKYIYRQTPIGDEQVPNPDYEAWKKKKYAAETRVRSAVPGFTNALKNYRTKLSENLESVITPDEEQRFLQKIPSRKILHFSAKKEASLGIWFMEVGPVVEFNLQNKIYDCTTDPRPAELMEIR